MQPHRMTAVVLLCVALLSCSNRDPATPVQPIGPHVTSSSVSAATPIFRWKDRDRRGLFVVLLSTNDEIAFGLHKHQPGPYQELLRKELTTPVFLFDLKTCKVVPSTGKEWAAGEPSLDFRLAPPAGIPPFDGLSTSDKQHFRPTDADWSARLGGRLISTTAVFEYGARQFVAVETFRKPGLGDVKSYSSRRGPYYLQVFDQRFEQVGPTYIMDGTEAFTMVDLSVLSEDPVVIATDYKTGMWWVVDYRPLLEKHGFP